MVKNLCVVSKTLFVCASVACQGVENFKIDSTFESYHHFEESKGIYNDYDTSSCVQCSRMSEGCEELNLSQKLIHKSGSEKESAKYELVWDDSPHYEAFKEVFLDCFVKCYKEIGTEALGFSSDQVMYEKLVSFYDRIFYQKEPQGWLTAHVDGQPAGFLSISHIQEKSYIYISLIAISPKFQGQGVARAMVEELLRKYSEVEKILLITRKNNEGANKFFLALGFTPSEYMHEGYSKKLYNAYEFILNHSS